MSGRASPKYNSHAQRSMLLRERVRDTVIRMSYGNYEYGLEAFAKRAVELGEAAGMRVWSDNTAPAIRSAVNSLKTLLGEYKHSGRTGANEHWVLDLWELVLHENVHGPVKIVRAETTPEPESQQDGVVVFEERRQAKQSELISAMPMRLMEAYVGRDDEAFMQLLLELEKLA